MIEELTRQLERDEGVRNKPYRDSVGKLTIGVGHNLDDRPISQRAIDLILKDDIEDAVAQLENLFPWTTQLDEARKGVLVNMMFNMGAARLGGFTDTLNLIRLARYPEAADEMLNSRWAKQVGPRALRLAQQMRSGAWQ